jgi:hypothetical protein
LTNGLSIEGVHTALDSVLHEVKKAGTMARARRVVRKNHKGEIDGVDLHHPDTGELLSSHKAVKDKNGRIVGLE